jgi:hypothetical protein
MTQLTHEQLTFISELPNIVYATQLAVGNHMKEEYYQRLLHINFIRKGFTANHTSVLENCVVYKLKNIEGEDVLLGNSIHGRTDIELTNLSMILEVKATSSATKPEHISQCRNYLISRDDVNIGIVVNFITKETRDVSPYTQIDVMYKTGKIVKITDTYSIPQFKQTSTVYTKQLPSLCEYVVTDDT